jgi:hypothetical protein
VSQQLTDKQYSALKKRERLLDSQAMEDLKWLLAQPQFRRWVIPLIYASEFCGVNKMIWDSSSRIHMLEGRRSVGIDVLKTFVKFPELYSILEHERVEAELDSLNRQKIREEDNG